MRLFELIALSITAFMLSYYWVGSVVGPIASLKNRLRARIQRLKKGPLQDTLLYLMACPKCLAFWLAVPLAFIYYSRVGAPQVFFVPFLAGFLGALLVEFAQNRRVHTTTTPPTIPNFINPEVRIKAGQHRPIKTETP